jgi:hypothetical protein
MMEAAQDSSSKGDSIADQRSGTAAGTYFSSAMTFTGTVRPLASDTVSGPPVRESNNYPANPSNCQTMTTEPIHNFLFWVPKSANRDFGLAGIGVSALGIKIMTDLYGNSRTVGVGVPRFPELVPG